MIVALTPTEALVGFRPVSEIRELLAQLAPFRRLIGGDAVDAIARAADTSRQPSMVFSEEVGVCIKTILEALLRTPASIVQSACHELLQFAVERILSEADDLNSDLVTELRLIRQVSAEHPGDIGVFVMLLMNHVHLRPGEAVFIDAGQLHAYLSGGD
jgi:mannose-6-phosphate isomerase